MERYSVTRACDVSRPLRPRASRFSKEEVMAKRLCLWALLCHLWLCFSGTAALRCFQVPLTQLGPRPSAPSSEQECKKPEMCHQTLLFVHSGPVVATFFSKGCTLPGVHPTGVSQYRQPPEVSITLYNHMCSSDLCNSEQAWASLWNMTAGSQKPSNRIFVPGDLLCPACAALKSCPDNSPFTPCPHKTRCYQGTIRLMTRNSSLPLAVWGCGPWTNCGLLDGFWTPGPIALNETCENEIFMRDLAGRWQIRASGVSPESTPAWKILD